MKTSFLVIAIFTEVAHAIGKNILLDKALKRGLYDALDEYNDYQGKLFEIISNLSEKCFGNLN